MIRRVAPVAVAALLLAGCGAASILHTRDYTVPNAAMEPTLKLGATIHVDTSKRTPTVGAIVVFHPPAGATATAPTCGDRRQGVGHRAACDTPAGARSSETFVKRVVGLPGDRLSFAGGHLIRDGRRVSEPYADVSACENQAPLCTFPATITVPAGEYYMVGDNRGASDDSRFWGPVPAASIIGTVTR